MKTLSFIAASLVLTSVAYGQDRTPVEPPTPVLTNALSCQVAGHPQAICFWIDPAAQNCFSDAILPANPVGFPAIHPFEGGDAICWSGNRALLAIAQKK